ncbi:MAG: ABC transporter ATP-binding protein [Gammaproteobacteria bacterium]|nr:ABC transporter ATP-binding protein [Gammaproteobacteria bacterium]
MQTPIINVVDVTKEYGNTTVLSAIDLKLNHGEVVALLGENGAGKTTLINTILGLTAHSKGAVKVFDADAGSKTARQRIGCVLQDTQLPDTLTPIEHLTLFSSYYPTPLPLEVLIDLLSLEDFAHRRLNQLSGGQKQRLYLALAMCGDPDIIFLDEPTVGLDIHSRKQLWNAIKKLQQAGKSIILTTHYLEEAEALAERLVYLVKGQIQFDGAMSEFKKQFNAKTICAISDLDIHEVDAWDTVTAVTRNQDRVSIVTHHVEAVLARLFQSNVNLSDLTVSSQTLENIMYQISQQNSDVVKGVDQ